MEERKMYVALLKRFNEEKIEVQTVKKEFDEFAFKVYSNMLLDGSLNVSFDRESLKEIVVLTSKGKYSLFIHENSDKIKEFESILEYQGFNVEYLSDFIKVRCINDEIKNIFSIEEYDAFTKYTRQLQNNAVIKRTLKRNREIE